MICGLMRNQIKDGGVIPTIKEALGEALYKIYFKD